jgi:cytochrome c peroxidase
MHKRFVILLLVIAFIVANLASWPVKDTLGAPQLARKRPPIVRLGERLFRDDRFSTPDGDLPASCSHCHLLDEDPQGLRAYADFFNRSWISSRTKDHRRLELRNSPTIFDVAEMPRLHYDGEFGSLEDLVKGTLSGRPMGWLPGEEPQAYEQIRAVLLSDKGEGRSAQVNYREQFKNAFGSDLEKLNRHEIVNLVATAIADFMRTLKTRKDSPFDRFIVLNGLENKPAANENSKAYAERLLAGIESLEARNSLKLPNNFSAETLRGLKIFFRTEGSASAGNCVACHAPPSFTDHSFHNLGISQREYDKVHGEGRFFELQIPDAANVIRPSARFRETPAKNRSGEADLGFWNFVDLKNSTLRRAGESDDRFLQRMIATFKTPTLRNLKYSQPYFHDGSLHTLEEVVEEIRRSSNLARSGRIREADEELVKIKIDATDLPSIVAFLNALNEDLARY